MWYFKSVGQYLSGTREPAYPDFSVASSAPPQEHSRITASESEKEEEREELREALSALYMRVENGTNTTLEEEEITRLGIRVKDFGAFMADHDKPGIFFKPSSVNPSDQYPLVNNEESRDWQRKCQYDKEIIHGCSPSSQAGSLCREIGWRFSRASREGMVSSLAGFMGWRSQLGFPECMIKDACRATLFYEQDHPSQSWEMEGDDRQDKPHLMLSLRHDFDRFKHTLGGDRLLRGEILIILAAMQGRMSEELFKDHSIIPIQLFSFMGLQGRIIQAYYDGKNLILHKGRLISFSYDTSLVDMFDIFVQYLACEPVGNTKEITRIREEGYVVL